MLSRVQDGAYSSSVPRNVLLLLLACVSCAGQVARNSDQVTSEDGGGDGSGASLDSSAGAPFDSAIDSGTESETPPACDVAEAGVFAIESLTDAGAVENTACEACIAASCSQAQCECLSDTNMAAVRRVRARPRSRRALAPRRATAEVGEQLTHKPARVSRISATSPRRISATGPAPVLRRRTRSLTSSSYRESAGAIALPVIPSPPLLSASPRRLVVSSPLMATIPLLLAAPHAVLDASPLRLAALIPVATTTPARLVALAPLVDPIPWRLDRSTLLVAEFPPRLPASRPLLIAIPPTTDRVHAVPARDPTRYVSCPRRS